MTYASPAHKKSFDSAAPSATRLASKRSLLPSGAIGSETGAIKGSVPAQAKVVENTESDPVSLQAKLTIGDVDDPLEREADRIAERLVTDLHPHQPNSLTGVDVPHERALIQRQITQRQRLADSAPSIGSPNFINNLQHAQAHGGHALDANVRSLMERGLGADLSRVKIHDDAAAASLARDIRARAFTVGNDLFFARGELRPHDRDGQKLLAHEFVHVLQQRHDMDSPIRRVPDDGPPTQSRARIDAALDAIEVPISHDVDKDSKASLANREIGAINARIGELELAVSKSSIGDCITIVGEAGDLLIELNRIAGQFTRAEIADKEKPIGHKKDKETGEKALDENISRRTALQKVHPILYDSTSPPNTIESILPAMTRLFVIIHMASQNVMDAALARSQTPSEEKQLLELLSTALTRVQTTANELMKIPVRVNESTGSLNRRLLAAAEHSAKPGGGPDPLKHEDQIAPAGLPLMITKTERGGDPYRAHHVDYFSSTETRAVSLNFYGFPVVGPNIPEKEMMAGTSLFVRQSQIKFLLDLRSGTSGPDSPAGQTTFDIHSNDDLRRYIPTLFDHLMKENGGSHSLALEGVIAWLSRYMYAFTTSTPYNIEEYVNYLGRAFPHALTGQLIHDCGVYALRIAYILSGLRAHPDLARYNITFDYIKLPSHVGLLMHHTIPGANQYMFANGKYEYVTDEQVKYGQVWQKGLTAKSMTAEVAANAFLPGLRSPYRVEPAEQSGTGTKEDHWQAYSTMAGNAPLFVDEERQFTGAPQAPPGQASAEEVLPMYLDSLAEDREISQQIRLEYIRIYISALNTHRELSEAVRKLPGGALAEEDLAEKKLPGRALRLEDLDGPKGITRRYLEGFRRLDQLLVRVGIVQPLMPLPVTDPDTVINDPRNWRSRHDETAQYWKGHVSMPGTTMSNPQLLSVWQLNQLGGNGELAAKVRRFKRRLEILYKQVQTADANDLELQRSSLEQIVPYLNPADENNGLIDPRELAPPRD